MKHLKSLLFESLVKKAGGWNKLSGNTYFLFPIFKKKKKDGYVAYDFDGSTRKIRIAPNKPFVIYKDKYHGLLHIATKTDMAMEIGFSYDDFEDFSESDIIGEYKTVRDAVVAAIEMSTGLSKSEIEEMEDKLKKLKRANRLPSKRTYDGVSIDSMNWSDVTRIGLDKLQEMDDFYDSADFLASVLAGLVNDVDVFDFDMHDKDEDPSQIIYDTVKETADIDEKF